MSQLLIYQRVRLCANLFWSDLVGPVILNEAKKPFEGALHKACLEPVEGV